MQARRLRRGDTADLQATLVLIQRAFSYMDGVVDPPSSMHRLTLDDLCSSGVETWVVGTPPVACVLMTPKPNLLYVSKLAVAAAERGRGLARKLLDQADARARELGMSVVELETRIELEANHRTFTALGFVEVMRSSHPGYDRPTSITFQRTVVAAGDSSDP